MRTLTEHLAQDIVTRTMKIIPFNVNVMDANGIIIGSGEPLRLGEHHTGAVLAITQQRTVEVDATSARYLPGARPGVNLLLTVGGEICGVVGLTGEPDAVRQFGELVRMTAEMILEQDQLNRDLQHNARYREEFVLQWIEGAQQHAAELAQWAARLAVDLRAPRMAVVVALDPQVRPDAALANLQHCQLRLAVAHPEFFTAAHSAHELIILAPPLAGEATEAAQKLLHILEAWFRRECDYGIRIALGAAFEGINGVAHSYQSAQAALHIANERRLEQTCVSYYTLRLPVLLASLGESWQAALLRAPLARLEQADRRGVLLTSLKAWFAANGQLSATAKALHIHRNTLDYRLRQIEEHTALQLGRLDDALLLYAALHLNAARIKPAGR